MGEKNMSMPLIDPLPPAPTPADPEDVFDEKAYETVAALAPFVEQTNVLALAVEAEATRSESEADRSQAQVNVATTEANRAQTEAERAKDEADRAEQARDDAVVVVTDGQGSLTPAPGKFPVAGTSGTIKQDWIENLQFEFDALRVARNKLMYGDGPYPVLDLQFQGAKLLDPRITFTRATPDWDWDGKRYEANEPILSNEGLRLWGSRTNLISNSENLLGNTTANATVTPTDTSWFRVDYDDESGTAPKSLQLITTGLYQDGDVLTGSVDLMKGSVTTVDIRLGRSEYTDAGTIDLEAGEVVRQGSSVLRLTTKKNGDGSVRVYISTTRRASPSAWYFQVGYEDVGPPNTQYSGHFFVKSPMLTESISDAPYIPTNGSQVTVAAAIASTSINERWFNPTQGTFIFDFVSPQTLDFGANPPNIFSFNGNIRAEIDRYGGIVLDMRSVGGNHRGVFPSGSVGAGERCKFSFSYFGNKNQTFFNGVASAVVSEPNLIFPNMTQQLRLGRRSTANFLNSNFIGVSYYDRQLTSEQLQELTS